MKLLHCRSCGDILRLGKEYRFCACKRSVALYVTDNDVSLWGPGRILVINNRDFALTELNDFVPEVTFFPWTVLQPSNTMIVESELPPAVVREINSFI